MFFWCAGDETGNGNNSNSNGKATATTTAAATATATADAGLLAAALTVGAVSAFAQDDNAVWGLIEGRFNLPLFGSVKVGAFACLTLDRRRH